MGFAPPPDAPSPDQQDAAEKDASFEPSPKGSDLCGFGKPAFAFGLNFKLPTITNPFLFIPFPSFDFMVALNCDLSDPIDASFGFGGGRVGKTDPDADDTQLP